MAAVVTVCFLLSSRESILRMPSSYALPALRSHRQSTWRKCGLGNCSAASSRCRGHGHKSEQSCLLHCMCVRVSHTWPCQQLDWRSQADGSPTPAPGFSWFTEPDGHSLLVAVYVHTFLLRIMHTPVCALCVALHVLELAL